MRVLACMGTAVSGDGDLRRGLWAALVLGLVSTEATARSSIRSWRSTWRMLDASGPRRRSRVRIALAGARPGRTRFGCESARPGRARFTLTMCTRFRTLLLGGCLMLSASVGCTRSSPPDSVVLVTIDPLRAAHLGAYGYDKPTSPAIDAVAPAP